MRKLDPDPMVLSIMKEGLKFDFAEIPPPYFEKNNKSCLENLEIAQEKIEKWLKKGIIYEVRHRPYCCSPLTVAAKTDF